MTLSIANAQAVAACDVYVDACDLGGGANATLVIYDGTPPTFVDSALSGNNVLAQLAMSATAFGPSADTAPHAASVANAVADDTNADATGTASFARILDKGNVPRIQGTVGTVGTDFIINTVSIVAGGTVSVVSITFRNREG